MPRWRRRRAAERGGWSEPTVYDVTSPLTAPPRYRDDQERAEVVAEAGKYIGYFTDESAEAFRAAFYHPELTPEQRASLLVSHARLMKKVVDSELVGDGVRLIADAMPDMDDSFIDPDPSAP